MQMQYVLAVVWVIFREVVMSVDCRVIWREHVTQYNGAVCLTRYMPARKEKMIIPTTSMCVLMH